MIKLKDSSTPTRREFCACAGLVAVAAAAAGCSGSPTGPSGNTQSLASVSSSVSGRTVTVPVGASSPLAATGSMAITQTSLGTFLLARTSPTTVSVLTATCTHEGTTITRSDGAQFVCPNHGAVFTTSGSVVSGPANRSLQQYPAAINGDNATFTA